MSLKHCYCTFMALLGCSLFIFAMEGTICTVALGDVTAQKDSEKSVRIEENGTLFAIYQGNCQGTPILWPVCSADGLLMTRGYPMINSIDPATEKDAELKNIYNNAKILLPTEASDHPHHRSIWLNHGDVNGYDFWTLSSKAKLEHQKFTKVESDGKRAIVVAENAWKATDINKVLCRDIRTITFGVLTCEGKKIRYIDYDTEIVASEGEVVFGDTKEGTFGVRVPGIMDVNVMRRNPKMGQKNKKWGGQIINSKGQKNDAAWAQRADWVDYYGPIAKRLDDDSVAKYNKSPNVDQIPLTTAGVTIMNHPGSFRAPSWWHVRTYGLYAVNPFGQKEFEPKNKDANGNLTLKKGESFRLAYRILLHDGELSTQTIDKIWKDYSAK